MFFGSNKHAEFFRAVKLTGRYIYRVVFIEIFLDSLNSICHKLRHFKAGSTLLEIDVYTYEAWKHSMETAPDFPSGP